MADVSKQMRIKTATLRRLRKEYQSYQKEVEDMSHKLLMKEQEVKSNPSEDSQANARKQKQFLSESEFVLSNVKQKLIEAFQGLANFLSEKGQMEGVEGTEEKNQAETLVLDTETFLQGLA